VNGAEATGKGYRTPLDSLKGYREGVPDTS
jgi:hypothetical protein